MMGISNSRTRHSYRIAVVIYDSNNSRPVELLCIEESKYSGFGKPPKDDIIKYHRISIDDYNNYIKSSRDPEKRYKIETSYFIPKNLELEDLPIIKENELLEYLERHPLDNQIERYLTKLSIIYGQSNEKNRVKFGNGTSLQLSSIHITREANNVIMEVFNNPTDNVIYVPDFVTQLHCELVYGDIKVTGGKGLRDLTNCFSNCENLTSLDLSLVTTESLRSISRMFNHCRNLKTINFGNLLKNNKKIKNIHGLFYCCNSLGDLNLLDLDVSGVRNFSDIFYCCSSFENLDISTWDTSRAISFKNTFYNCFGLKSIKLGKLRTTRNLKSTAGMFYSCIKLKSINISYMDLRGLENCSQMFCDCASLVELKLPRRPDLRNINYNYKVFYRAGSIEQCEPGSSW